MSDLDFEPTRDTPRTRGKTFCAERINVDDINNFFSALYDADSGVRSVIEDVDIWAENNDADRWQFISEIATEPAPMGAYIIIAAVRIEDQTRADMRPVAIGVLTHDQHDAGKKYGVQGPWLAAGRVFPPYRSQGFHHELVRARLEALLAAGITTANIMVGVDNPHCLCSVLKAGFRPFAIGPECGTNSDKDDTVFLHWDAKWCPWLNDRS